MLGAFKVAVQLIQLSETVGVAQVATPAGRLQVTVLYTWGETGQLVMIGPWVSFTVTLKVQVPVLPAPSVVE